MMITGMAALGVLAATGSAFAYNTPNQEGPNLETVEASGKYVAPKFDPETMIVDSTDGKVNPKEITTAPGKYVAPKFDPKTMEAQGK